MLVQAVQEGATQGLRRLAPRRLVAVDEQFEIAEVAVTQRVIAPKAGGQRGRERRGDLGADVLVLQAWQSRQPGQPDARGAVAPGGRAAPRRRGSQIAPVARLCREQATLVGDATTGRRPKALLAGARKECQERPGDAGRTVRETSQLSQSRDPPAEPNAVDLSHLCPFPWPVVLPLIGRLLMDPRAGGPWHFQFVVFDLADGLKQLLQDDESLGGIDGCP